MRKTSGILFCAAVLYLGTLSRAVEQKWVLGMSQCNLGEPWRVQMNDDIRKAAVQHPGLAVVFKDAQNDTLKQRAHVEEFVNAKVGLLIISPKEAAPLTAPVAEAYRRGIPVIVLDRRVLGTDYTTFIGADNRKIGRAAGRWVAGKLGSRGKIVELKGLMTSTPGQDRHSGFLEGIKGTDLEIVFAADMKWLEPDARKEMESALAVHKQIGLVYAHNDPGAHGAYLAAKAVGREKAMLFVGIDGLPQEGQIYVQQGILAASFEYPTGGKEAVETALRILKGEKVPKEITLRSRVFTPENIKKGGEWLDQIPTNSRFETRDSR
jgi:ribose transport system substrate-binding protein